MGSLRAFGVILKKFSLNSIIHKSPRFFHPHSNGLCSSSSLAAVTSSSPLWAFDSKLKSRGNQVRRIWMSPVCMGRRSCKIAGRKGAQNAKKAKLYCRIAKEVVSAQYGNKSLEELKLALFHCLTHGISCKRGGTSPTSNPLLTALLEKFKELDIPKEIFDRNIKRASEKGQEAYIEKTYEVYGYGGASMVVEVSTDKINRSVAAIREVLKDYGGKMANSGSVMFKFRRARVVNVKASNVDKDHLLTISLDAGAEDVIEPPEYEDDTEEDKLERYYKIVTSTENYSGILSTLREENIEFETDGGSELLPISSVEVDDEAMDLNKELMDKLLEIDDVDAVYTDQK